MSATIRAAVAALCVVSFACSRPPGPSADEAGAGIDPVNARLAPEHATEFGAFEQSYGDSSGARTTEFGRYVAYLVRREDGAWRMDRFFGFADSTRPAAARP